MILYFVIALVAAAITAVFSMIVFKLSYRLRLYPKIRERDVHTRPTPRLGGVAMFGGVVVAFAIASQINFFHLVFASARPVLAVLGACAIIVILGVVDDIWDLDWVTKLAGQIIAGGVLALGVQVTLIPIGGISLFSPFMYLAITVLVVVLVMNAVNFIDGLDGLVAGVSIIANGVFLVYSYLLSVNDNYARFNLASLITAIVVGVCAGFLPFNWRPAKLFMGDAGALLVGLLMATSTIAVLGQFEPGVSDDGSASRLFVPAIIPILLPFAVLLLPLLDFALAIIRRLRAGKSPFSADRLHLHHRLLDMGHTHLQAVLIFYAWTLVISIGCLLFFFMPWLWALSIIVVGLVACTWVTLSPLGRRKQLELAVQSTDASVAEAEDVAKFDPLDAAADPIDIGQEFSDEEADVALVRLHEKDTRS